MDCAGESARLLERLVCGVEALEPASWEPLLALGTLVATVGVSIGVALFAAGRSRKDAMAVAEKQIAAAREDLTAQAQADRETTLLAVERQIAADREARRDDDRRLALRELVIVVQSQMVPRSAPLQAEIDRLQAVAVRAELCLAEDEARTLGTCWLTMQMDFLTLHERWMIAAKDGVNSREAAAVRSLIGEWSRLHLIIPKLLLAGKDIALAVDTIEVKRKRFETPAA